MFTCPHCGRQTAVFGADQCDTIDMGRVGLLVLPSTDSIRQDWHRGLVFAESPDRVPALPSNLARLQTSATCEFRLREARAAMPRLAIGPCKLDQSLTPKDAVASSFTAQWAEPIMRKIDNVFS